MNYQEMSKQELQQEQSKLQQEYAAKKAEGLKLDMARGKPSTAQLDLSRGLLSVLGEKDSLRSEDGSDVRNYGGLQGIVEARKLFGELMGVPADQVIMGGSASLQLMYDAIAKAYCQGLYGGEKPWSECKNRKWICVVPGYDRHFSITEAFGFEMINVDLTPTGPDMDAVEKLVQDESVKGIWCVPVYSNPDGVTYSDETVRRLAALKPAAKDFRIFWDNAYFLHHLYDEEERQEKVLNILDECAKAGNPHMVYAFCSTSKITFAGAGISAMAASKENIDFLLKQLNIQTISYDKVNQLRHVRFFKNAQGVKDLMKRHAALLRPKFELVLRHLREDLGDCGIARWQEPQGGYFVSFYAQPGCATRIVHLCKEAGLTLTGAGAAYPYGKDPQDAHIRIAPSLPPCEELEKAMSLFTLCVKLATVEKLLANENI